MSTLPTFEEKAGDIVRVAAEIARAQRVEQEAAVLEKASASLIYSGVTNDDQSIYTLTLEIPIGTYVEIEKYREGLEQSI